MSRSFRSTALEWLGRLPADWGERSIGREAWVRARLGWKGLTASEYVESGGHPMLSTPNIKGRDIDFLGAARISKERYEESPEIMLSEGDILLTKDGSTIGTVNIVRELPEPATVNGSIAVITPRSSLEGRFLYWVIASQYAQSIFRRLRDGMGVPHLFQRDINRIKIPFPPRDEQRSIADFLDRETAQIDTLIAKQQRLIATLRERRAALIDRMAVGRMDPLDSAAKGDWPVTALGFGFSVVLGKMLDAGKTRDEAAEDRPYIRAANIKDHGLDLSDVKTMPFTPEESSKFDLKRDDLLVVEGGAIGTSVVLREDLPGWSYQKTVNRLRGYGGWNPQFYAYVLLSYRDRGVLDILANKSTIAHLTAEKLRALRVPVPPVGEQDRIVSYLNEQTARIDTLIQKSEGLIELSQERRAALITAAVTGQIDVRKAA